MPSGRNGSPPSLLPPGVFVLRRITPLRGGSARRHAGRRAPLSPAGSAGRTIGSGVAGGVQSVCSVVGFIVFSLSGLAGCSCFAQTGSAFVAGSSARVGAAANARRGRRRARRFIAGGAGVGRPCVAWRAPRRLRPGVAASPLAGKRVHGAGSFAPSAESAWRAGAAWCGFSLRRKSRSSFQRMSGSRRRKGKVFFDVHLVRKM